MLTINEPQQPVKRKESRKPWQLPIFDLLFRSHFLLASIASVISLSLWMSYITHGFSISHNGLTPLVWHIHEMIFTFAATVAVGFILTAVQTWTGKASVKGIKALSLILLWLVSHVMFWFNTQYTVPIALVFKTLWWLFVIACYAEIVIATNNRRNFVFIPILAIMATLNFSIVLLDYTGNTSVALHISKTMVFVFVFLISILGGRVIPFFTVNGAKTTSITNVLWLERAAFLLSLITAITYLIHYWVNVNAFLAILLLVTGCLHIFRLSKWRTIKTIKIPLLWSLHIAYLFMSIGLLLIGISTTELFKQFPATYGIHLITVGCIGLMILSMMSRVSLGHTGRMLNAPPLMTIAFATMILSTLCRVILPGFGLATWGWTISTIGWLIAFISFLLYYTPILFKAKIT